MPECSLVPRTGRASRRARTLWFARWLLTFNSTGRITPTNFATRDTGWQGKKGAYEGAGAENGRPPAYCSKMCRLAQLVSLVLQ